MSVAAAVKIDSEVDRARRNGMLTARKVSSQIRRKALRAFREGSLIDVRAIVLGYLSPILTDAMTAAHLFGERRSRLLLPKELRLDYSSTVKALAQKSKLDIATLNKKYETTVFDVLSEASKKVNDELREVVADLITEGSTIRQGITALDEAFDRLGLSPKKDYQLETIFRTQTQLAYGAGRWEADQDPAVQEILWGYKYVTVGDDRVRESHAELDGTLLPKDDPFWETFWPPNGWNCRCQAIPIFDERTEVKAPNNAEADEGFRFNAGQALALAFDPNQPRDAMGRFGSGGGGTVTRVRSPKKASYDKAAKKLSKQYGAVNSSAPTTQGKFKSHDGTYSPERAALHDGIKQQFFAGKEPVPEGEKPTAYLLGGGPASGKSTALMTGSIEIPERAVAEDGDTIKTLLPEYQAALQNGVREGASVVHGESADVAWDVLTEATTGANKFDVVMDGTGDHSVEHLKEKTQLLRDRGYKVKASYMTVPISEAVTRSDERGHRTGRYVPHEVVRGVHQQVSRVVPEAIKQGLFDEFELFDNSGGDTVRRVASAKGSKLTVHNEKLWQAFLNKAN